MFELEAIQARHSVRKYIDKPFPDWFVRGIEAALLAPTAVNQQKLEFVLHPANHVEAKTKFSFIGYTHIDLGIAKYHFELAADKENFNWQ